MERVCDSNKPMMLRKRIESDLRFAHAKLRKDYKAFQLHAIHLSKAFQLVDNGKPFAAESDVTRDKRKPTKIGKSGKLANTRGPWSANDEKTRNKETTTKSAPVCLYGPCKDKSIRHRLKDCPDCQSDQKKALLDEYYYGKNKKSAVLRLNRRGQR